MSKVCFHCQSHVPQDTVNCPNCASNKWRVGSVVESASTNYVEQSLRGLLVPIGPRGMQGVQGLTGPCGSTGYSGDTMWGGPR